MSRIKDAIVAGLVLLASRGRPKVRPRRPPVVPSGPQEPRAELLAIGLLGLAGLCAAAFVAVYALDRIPDQTQFLGLALGLSLVFVALALLVVSKRLVVSEELAEAYPPEEHADEVETIEQILDESGSRVTRKGLFKLALGGTGLALLAALLAPAASLGPVIDVDSLFRTPWRRRAAACRPRRRAAGPAATASGRASRRRSPDRARRLGRAALRAARGPSRRARA